MTEIYHVCSRNKIDEITEEGILFQPTDKSWIESRRNLRKRIDIIGNRKFDDWINRVGAVFFWTTLEDAKTYSRVISGTPAIVVVESDNLELFRVDNQEVEFLFEQYMNNQIDNEVDEMIGEMLQYAQKWDGEKRKRQEIWTRPPVSSEEIVDIINLDGTSIGVP